MKKSKFVDCVRILAQGGKGGMGLPKFGGIGGKGGDIFVKASKKQTLHRFSNNYRERLVKGGIGEHSRNFQIIGTPGEDKILNVPVGINIATNNGGKQLAELNAEGEKVLIARGGMGGSVDNQYAGQPGQQIYIEFILKLIADIGLVGFPNAGKSTLLKAISRASPKIASYPFTTLHPQIGVIQYPDKREIKMADLPGLIEGAWINIGMGHKFLRHVERTKLLLFVVDIDGFRLSPNYPHRTALDNIILLNRELELYKPELVEKPCMLLVNKMDLPGAQDKFDKLKDQLADIEEISKSYPEEMQPDRFVNFDEVCACSIKHDADSVLEVKELVRRLLDKHDEDNARRDKLLEEAKERIEGQLTERSTKVV